jgi:hypothetical protein
LLSSHSLPRTPNTTTFYFFHLAQEATFVTLLMREEKVPWSISVMAAASCWELILPPWNESGNIYTLISCRNKPSRALKLAFSKICTILVAARYAVRDRKKMQKLKFCAWEIICCLYSFFTEDFLMLVHPGEPVSILYYSLFCYFSSLGLKSHLTIKHFSLGSWKACFAYLTIRNSQSVIAGFLFI